MNDLKIKYRLLTLIVVFTLFTSFSNTYNQDASIIGTWASEEDNNYKIVFNETTCSWLYSGQTTSTYNFTLSNTSPHCGQDVPITNETKYLRLINTTNTSDQICYEIYALSETTLTLRVVDQNGFLIFNRQ
jgi:hypothetical protein